MPSDSLTTTTPRQLFKVLAAGAVALIVVHSLGRFIYTPLLPHLVADGLFSAADGAAVASWNYFGYLVGAMLAIRWHRPGQIRILLPAALLVHTLTTLLATQAENLELICALRGINGVANGMVFVQAPALILEWLASRNRLSLSGLVYTGVGLGLLASSGLVSGTADWLQGPARWWPALLLSVPLALWAAVQLARLDLPERARGEDGETGKTSPLLDRASTPLFLSYAGAGLGYILPMTFLPLLAQQQLPEGHWLLDGAWLLVALCTIPGPWLWNRLGGVMGDLPALKLNYVLQLAGVLMAVLWPGAPGLVACAVLVGVTFVGTVLLTQRIGRALHPHQGPRLSAAMITVYGFTQMAGPWLTRQWLDMGGTLASAFAIGVAALAFGLIFVFFVPRPEDFHAGQSR